MVAAAIRDGNASGFSGTITEWPHDRVEQGDWSPVKFFSDYLVAKCWKWFTEDENQLFIPLCDEANVGPSGGGIRGAFIRSDTSDNDGRQALWFNDQSDKPSALATKICMEQQPDSYINAKPNRKDYASTLWEQRGRLMIPEKIRTTSVVTAAVRSTTPALGSHWNPVRHKTEEVGNDWEKAMCVYLNSTVGLLAAISISSPFVLGMPKMSLEGQRKIPIPKLDDEQITHLAKVYDTQKTTRLERLRHPDSAPRVTLDQAISETIAIPPDQITTARQELSQEPAITNRPHKSTKS